MSLDHAPSCICALCRHIRAAALPIQQIDRELFAEEWEYWISSTDGEAAKLRAGNDGNPGSPRWVALQAIARARISSSEARDL